MGPIGYLIVISETPDHLISNKDILDVPKISNVTVDYFTTHDYRGKKTTSFGSSSSRGCSRCHGNGPAAFLCFAFVCVMFSMDNTRVLWRINPNTQGTASSRIVGRSITERGADIPQQQTA